MRIVKPFTVTDATLISSTVAENDFAAYNSSTSYTLGQQVMVASVHKIYKSLRGGSSVVTITVASPAVIYWPAHGLANGTAVTFSTTGTLPTGIVAGTTYYVVNAATDTFNVSATLSGSPINTSGTPSGTHTCYDTPNLNHDPTTSPTWWLDMGSTNKWKVFDQYVQSQTTATTSLSFTVSVNQLMNTVALLNLTANSVQVVVNHGADGVLYNTTQNLYTDETPVVDMWSYFFSDFRHKTDAVFDDIPICTNANVTVNVNGSSGSTVGIGVAVIGNAKDIASAKKGVEQGARVGITDYSVKTTDAFGNYTITERAFAKRATWDVYVNNEDIDYVQQLLADVRAKPTLYLGSKQYGSAAIYGYYKTQEIAISYPDVSVLSCEIDGLT